MKGWTIEAREAEERTENTSAGRSVRADTSLAVDRRFRQLGQLDAQSLRSVASLAASPSPHRRPIRHQRSA